MTLVVMTRSAHAGVKGDLVVAEATDEVGMDSILHFVPFVVTDHHRMILS